MGDAANAKAIAGTAPARYFFFILYEKIRARKFSFPKMKNRLSRVVEKV